MSSVGDPDDPLWADEGDIDRAFALARAVLAWNYRKTPYLDSWVMLGSPGPDPVGLRGVEPTEDVRARFTTAPDPWLRVSADPSTPASVRAMLGFWFGPLLPRALAAGCTVWPGALVVVCDGGGDVLRTLLVAPVRLGLLANALSDAEGWQGPVPLAALRALPPELQRGALDALVVGGPPACRAVLRAASAGLRAPARRGAS